MLTFNLLSTLLVRLLLFADGVVRRVLLSLRSHCLIVAAKLVMVADMAVMWFTTSGGSVGTVVQMATTIY